MSGNKNIQGFVLTGGASSRMGRNKASLIINERTLAQHAVDALRQVCDSVFTAGGESGFSDAPHLIDIEPPFTVKGRAAMTGIYTALSNCTAEFAAVLACDMPNVTADVFHILLRNIENDPSCDVAVPRDAEGKTQQLCSVLRRGRCLSAIKQLPPYKTPAVKEMLALLNVKECAFAEFGHLLNSQKLFANLNTPDEFSAHR
jgi:molybdopterin-guanine dinucleotide biosynthesis protein A